MFASIQRYVKIEAILVFFNQSTLECCFLNVGVQIYSQHLQQPGGVGAHAPHHGQREVLAQVSHPPS